MDGWVQFHRKSMKSQVYQDDLTWKLWSECLFRASYADRFVTVRVGRGMKTIELKRGQLIYGRNQWAERLGRKPSSIHRRMKQLEKWGNVRIQVGNHYSIITVCEYETYNPTPGESEQPNGQQTDSKRTANGQQADTKKKEKKEKKHSSCRNLRFDEQDLETSKWMFARIQQVNPLHKEPDFEKWANDLRLIRERDSRTDAEIRGMFGWANDDQFWQANILCPATLRKQWDKLMAKRTTRSVAEKKPELKMFGAEDHAK